MTDAEGRFNIPFLTPGTYSVRAELQGFKAAEQKDVIVGLGQAVDLPVKMEVGGLAETVQVVGSSPIVDTGSTTTGAVLSSDMISKVPVGRRISDALYGAWCQHRWQRRIGEPIHLWRQRPREPVRRRRRQHHQPGLRRPRIVLDRVRLRSATRRRSTSSKEIQIKTGGYEAEFGQSTGGVVNVITKSGTNELHGSVFGYARPDKLEGDWTQVTSPNGTINIAGTHMNDAGLEGGAPVIKNRLFFFGAIDRGWEQRTSTAPPDFPLASGNPYDRDRRTFSYSAKGTLQLSSAHRIDASFFGDPSEGLNGPQRGGALLNQSTSGFSSLTYGGIIQTVWA